MKSIERRIITVDDERLAALCLQGRVIIIDDDSEILASFRALLEFEGYAVDTYSSAENYLQILAEGAPQFPGPVCLLCDVNMPALNGLELQRQLLALEDTPIVLMSGVSGASEVATAFRAGAVDFLLKPISAEVLLPALIQSLEVSRREQIAQSRQTTLQRRAASLSEREREVIDRVAKGMTNQAVADDLQVALRTVKLHRQRAMLKLDVATVAELVRVIDGLSQAS